MLVNDRSGHGDLYLTWLITQPWGTGYAGGLIRIYIWLEVQPLIKCQINDGSSVLTAGYNDEVALFTSRAFLVHHFLLGGVSVSPSGCESLLRQWGSQPGHYHWPELHASLSHFKAAQWCLWDVMLPCVPHECVTPPLQRSTGGGGELWEVMMMRASERVCQAGRAMTLRQITHTPTSWARCSLLKSSELFRDQTFLMFVCIKSAGWNSVDLTVNSRLCWICVWKWHSGFFRPPASGTQMIMGHGGKLTPSL